MPLFGPPNVEKLAQKKDVIGLIKALSYKDSAVIRGEAVVFLRRFGGEEVVKALVNALGDVDAGVRRRAVSALDELKDERALEPLIALLQDKDSIVRHFATIALVDYKDARIVQPILAMLDTYGEKLSNIHSPSILAALDAVGKPAIEPLMQALLQGKPGTRSIAAQALQKLTWLPGEDHYGASYYAALKLWDPLMELGDQAIPPLSLCLKSADAEERAQAIRCLGQIGSESAVSLLPPMLDDSDKRVKLTALDVLESLADPKDRERVFNAGRELSGYRAELQLKQQTEKVQQAKEKANRRKELIRNSICRVKFRNGRASLDPGNEKLTLVDLFLQKEPAIVYELDEIQDKLDDFPWSSYPVAVNFSARRKTDLSIRNFFRCSGTFFYKGEQGIIDKRPRIYFISTNIDGILDLNGKIEYEEDYERGPFSKNNQIVSERKKSVFEPANYGVIDGKFNEVMENSVYAMHLLDTDISRILSQFERHGTKFYSFNVKHIIRDDNDDVQFRAQVSRRNEAGEVP